MAVETLSKVSLQLRLENGRDAKGVMTYVNQTIQYTSKNGYDADKYLAVVAALEPCLSKTLGEANVIKTSSVSAS